MRSGDDRRDRSRMLRAEPCREQVLEVAERNAAVDRAAGGEGDDQRIRPAGRTGRALGRILDLREPAFERGDLAVPDWRRWRRSACTGGLTFWGSAGCG